jgi:hypothetical protein
MYTELLKCDTMTPMPNHSACDAACALITASREGLLDRKILNDMSRV